MTVEQFYKYCKRNKPTRIIPYDYCIEFHFKTRVVIQASNGIDCIIYTKQRKCKGNSKALIADLLEIAPKFMDDIKRKHAPMSKEEIQLLDQSPFGVFYKK